jgi:hypothetical protein
MLYAVDENITLSSDLQSAIDDLKQVIEYRLRSYFDQTKREPEDWLKDTFNGDLFKPDILKHVPQVSSADEWIILMLALVPHVLPHFYTALITEHLPAGGDFPEFGGVKALNHRGLLPTGETAQFVLAGNDVSKRTYVQNLLQTESGLVKGGIINLEQVKEGEPVMSGRLIMAQDIIERILFGKEKGIQYTVEFPAKRIATHMDWDDLVLNNYTHSQINDIAIWIQHNAAVMRDAILQRKIKPGYRVLFYGPSGTGKTLTAMLLGKRFAKDVYRIDISQMVSKYIGETEKNLEKVFSKAEHKDWILFFDEADALFGKRTNVQSSHDRYANQEVSYLLQRIEDYPGLLILASNLKTNMDDAFLRRFHGVIHFPHPKPAERLKLWQKTIPADFILEPAINLAELSEKYELNGAAILNIIHYVTLKSASRNDEFIRQADILDAIRKEYRKEERSMT